MILSATELLEEEIDWSTFSSKFPETAIIIEKSMKKFAKIHVEAALENVIKEIHPEKGKYLLKEDVSILNSYSLENIK